jgi:hypothetical protein
MPISSSRLVAIGASPPKPRPRAERGSPKVQMGSLFPLEKGSSIGPTVGYRVLDGREGGKEIGDLKKSFWLERMSNGGMAKRRLVVPS